MAWAAKSAWGSGGAAAAAERARLPKGDEECHICGADSPVEIKLLPCKHELCLDCSNALRNANIFRADAGIKCPFCREFVDGFTDMNGRQDTVSDLVEANRAARKSMIARRTGAEKAVSTGVPDPQRLVPPVAPVRPGVASAASEVTWTCSHCRHANQGNRAECSRCRCDNPSHARSGVHKDPLTASEDDILRAACEKHHPGLSKAFQEAGTPCVNHSITSSPDSIRRALRSKGHERLMRVAHVLTSGSNCKNVGTDFYGNFAVQMVLEATHLVRMQAAAEMQSTGTPIVENFTSLPEGSPCTAMKAFTQLLRCITEAMYPLVTSEKGVFVLLRLLKWASPPETIYIADQASSQMMEWMLTKDGAMFVSNLLEKLSHLAAGGEGLSPAVSHKAAGMASKICGLLSGNNRVLIQSARHQYLGPPVVQLMQAALPHINVFKMGHQLTLNAAQLCHNHSGCHTIKLMLQLKGADQLGREMIRDLGCYTAKALQGQFGHLALRSELGGDKVVRALTDLLLAEREDEWLRQITEEVVAAGAELKGTPDGQGLLAHCLALPLWSPPEAQRHWARLADMPLNLPALRQQVQTAKAGQERLPARVHASVSEVQPTSPAEALHRFPHYARDGAAQPTRHSMLKRATSSQQQDQGQAAAFSPPRPPPRPQEAQQQQQQQRVPPPGFAGAGPSSGAAAAAATAPPAAKPAVPPGFAAPVAAAAALASKPPTENGSVAFPNGARVPMPQPYSAAGSGSAAAGQAGSALQGAVSAPPPAPPPHQQQQASSSSSTATAAAPLAAAPPGKPVPPPQAPAPAPAPQQQQQQPWSPPSQVQQQRQQPQQPALNVSAAPFMQHRPAAAQRSPLQQATAPTVARQNSTGSGSSSSAMFTPGGLSPTAAPFMQPGQSMPPPPAPRLSTAAPPFQPQQLPPHLATLPPHLQQQQAMGMSAAASSSGFSAPGGGMPAPPTPPPPQHAAGGFATAQMRSQQQPQQQLPPPQMAALLPPTFGAAGAGMPRPAARPPPPQQPMQQPVSWQASGAGGAGPSAAPASSSAVFGGFSSLTEMLTELTATAAPAPVPRPTYRPAYRPPGAAVPAYRPPTAPAPAAPAAPAAAPPQARVASPAERFLMPAAPPRPAAPVPAASAPAPASAAAAVAAAASWDCKVCSYRHEGQESNFLCCSVCGSTRV